MLQEAVLSDSSVRVYLPFSVVIPTTAFIDCHLTIVIVSIFNHTLHILILYNVRHFL